MWWLIIQTVSVVTVRSISKTQHAQGDLFTQAVRKWPAPPQPDAVFLSQDREANYQSTFPLWSTL